MTEQSPNTPENPTWNRLDDHEKRLKKLEERNTKILECVRSIERQFKTFITLFKDGELPTHLCIQSTEIQELKKEMHNDREQFYDRLEKRDEKIYDAFTVITSNQAKIQERLNKKRDKDKEQNGYLTKDAEEIDELQNKTAKLETDNQNNKLILKLVLGAIITMLITLLIFFIEFQYKTFILGI